MTVNPSASPQDAPPEAIPPEIAASLSDDEQEASNARLVGATGILSLGNIASRILGLARETVLSFFFGASAATDAFNVAVSVPKAFYDLLIGGHVNGAIVPVLSEMLVVNGRDAMWRVVSILCSLIVTLVIGLVAVIQIFAPQIVQLAAGGYDAQTQALAVDLLRITSPALMFLGLFAILSGTLYALKAFTWPAFAGVVFNAAIVAVTIILAPPIQFMLADGYAPTAPILLGRPADGIVAAAIGWFVGALVQFLLQLPGLRGAQIRLTFNWRHPALRRIALLYTPVVLSLIMDTLVIRFFSYNLASQTGIDGSIAYMNWATTLIQFPQGLVATAISIAILPTLSEQATHIAAGLTMFRNTLGLGLRLALTLIVPAAVGLFVLAMPIIRLIFEHGEFTATDTGVTALALRFYLIGLPFAAVDLLLVYAFYARKNTLTPALVGFFSHILYMLTVLLLFERFSLFSLMIADSVKHIAHAIISALLLQRLIDGYGDQRLTATSIKTGIAAGVMGIAAYAILPALFDLFGTRGIINEAIVVMIAGGVSMVVYLAMAAVLRLDEVYWVGRLIKARFSRS